MGRQSKARGCGTCTGMQYIATTPMSPWTLKLQRGPRFEWSNTKFTGDMLFFLSIVVVFFWQKKVRGEIFFLLIFYECDSGTSLISWRWSYVPCHSPCASFFQCKHICVVCAHAYVIIHLISSPFPPFSFISLPCWHCTWYTRQWPLEISLLQTTTCQEFPDKWGLGKVYMI